MKALAWFRGAWRALEQRRRLVAEYERLKGLQLVLADMALRGGLYAPPNQASDLYQAGVLEGRRQFAVETIRFAGLDPAIVEQICLDRPPQEKTR